jgi:peptidoglycan/xylan/chitin deacetylase (PgdA/CDA1 family)
MISLAMAAGLGAMATGILAHGTFHPNSPLFGRVIGRGSPSRRKIYLTFDDGPNPSATEKILEILDRQAVPATFFMVGQHVERFPDIARRVGDSLHGIGNHTYHHLKLHFKGPRRIHFEMERSHAAIVSNTGRSPQLFRAPHGYRNPFVTSIAHGLGYRVIGWTFGVWDSDQPGVDVIRRRIRKGLRPGAILLLHDGDGYDQKGDRRQTAAALPGIIADAKAEGYVFRPLEDLVKP